MTTALAVQLLPDNDEELGESKMGFLDHLDELRKRLIRSCIAVAVGMLVAFAFIDRIVNFVLAPTRRMLPPGTRMIYTSPGEAFGLYVNIALIVGALLAAPFIMFQVWRFIAPGLYTNEKKSAIPFVVLTTVGTVAAAAFSHYIVFPYMMAFFGTFNSPTLAFMPRVEDSFDLWSKRYETTTPQATTKIPPDTSHAREFSTSVSITMSVAMSQVTQNAARTVLVVIGALVGSVIAVHRCRAPSSCRERRTR
jgi:Tat protein translocase TatC